MVESSNPVWDSRFGVFDTKSPLVIPTMAEPTNMKYKALMKDPKTKQEWKIELWDQAHQLCGDDIKQGVAYDHVEEFRMQNSVGLMETSNQYGYLLIAFANCLIVLDHTQMQPFVECQQTLKEINAPYFVCEDIIRFMRISSQCDEKWLTIQVGQQVYFIELLKLLTLHKSMDQKSTAFPAPSAKFTLKENNQVRQVSFSPNQSETKCLLIEREDKASSGDPDLEFTLHLISLENGKPIMSLTGIITAIFNKSGGSIIAGADKLKDHLLILDKGNLQVKNTINLTFAEHVKFDVYRPFQLMDYTNNHMLLCASGFEDQDKVDENYGFPIIFWFGQDLDERTTLAQLKTDQKIKYFYDTDVVQNSDLDPPGFKLIFVKNPKVPTTMLGVLSMSQSDNYILFQIENDTIKCFYDILSNDKLHINRPVVRGEELDSTECLGTSQGIVLMQFKLQGNPPTMETMLTDMLETYQFPPYVLLYSVNGKISPYYVLYSNWAEDQLLNEVKEVKVAENNNTVKKEETKTGLFDSAPQVQTQPAPKSEPKATKENTTQSAVKTSISQLKLPTIEEEKYVAPKVEEKKQTTDYGISQLSNMKPPLSGQKREPSPILPLSKGTPSIMDLSIKQTQESNQSNKAVPLQADLSTFQNLSSTNVSQGLNMNSNQLLNQNQQKPSLGFLGQQPLQNQAKDQAPAQSVVGNTSSLFQGAQQNNTGQTLSQPKPTSSVLGNLSLGQTDQNQLSPLQQLVQQQKSIPTGIQNQPKPQANQDNINSSSISSNIMGTFPQQQKPSIFTSNNNNSLYSAQTKPQESQNLQSSQQQKPPSVFGSQLTQQQQTPPNNQQNQGKSIFGTQNQNQQQVQSQQQQPKSDLEKYIKESDQKIMQTYNELVFTMLHGMQQQFPTIEQLIAFSMKNLSNESLINMLGSRPDNILQDIQANIERPIQQMSQQRMEIYIQKQHALGLIKRLRYETYSSTRQSRIDDIRRGFETFINNSQVYKATNKVAIIKIYKKSMNFIHNIDRMEQYISQQEELMQHFRRACQQVVIQNNNINDVQNQSISSNSYQNNQLQPQKSPFSKYAIQSKYLKGRKYDVAQALSSMQQNGSTRNVLMDPANETLTRVFLQTELEFVNNQFDAVHQTIGMINRKMEMIAPKTTASITKMNSAILEKSKTLHQTVDRMTEKEKVMKVSVSGKKNTLLHEDDKDELETEAPILKTQQKKAVDRKITILNALRQKCKFKEMQEDLETVFSSQRSIKKINISNISQQDGNDTQFDQNAEVSEETRQIFQAYMRSGLPLTQNSMAQYAANAKLTNDQQNSKNKVGGQKQTQYLAQPQQQVKQIDNKQKQQIFEEKKLFKAENRVSSSQQDSLTKLSIFDQNEEQKQESVKQKQSGIFETQETPKKKNVYLNQKANNEEQQPSLGIKKLSGINQFNKDENLKPKNSLSQFGSAKQEWEHDEGDESESAEGSILKRANFQQLNLSTPPPQAKPQAIQKPEQLKLQIGSKDEEQKQNTFGQKPKTELVPNLSSGMTIQQQQQVTQSLTKPSLGTQGGIFGQASTNNQFGGAQVEQKTFGVTDVAQLASQASQSNTGSSGKVFGSGLAGSGGLTFSAFSSNSGTTSFSGSKNSSSFGGNNSLSGQSNPGFLNNNQAFGGNQSVFGGNQSVFGGGNQTGFGQFPAAGGMTGGAFGQGGSFGQNAGFGSGLGAGQATFNAPPPNFDEGKAKYQGTSFMKARK